MTYFLCKHIYYFDWFWFPFTLAPKQWVNNPLPKAIPMNFMAEQGLDPGQYSVKRTISAQESSSMNGALDCKSAHSYMKLNPRIKFVLSAGKQPSQQITCCSIYQPTQTQKTRLNMLGFRHMFARSTELQALFLDHESTHFSFHALWRIFTFQL